MKKMIFKQCQAVFPEWKKCSIDDFTIEDPKGFSSFTLSIRCQKKEIKPSAILYRRLEGKENPILDFENEKEIFLLLGREPDTVFKWTFPILLFIRGNWVFEHPQMSILLFNKIRVLSKRMSGPRGRK